VSRNGHTFKHGPHLCEELAHAVKAHDAVIDGEIVCLDARGRSNFKSLLFRREWPYFYAFDLLAVDGEDLREWPPSVDSSKPAINRQFKTHHFWRATETRGVLLRGLLRAQVGVDLGAPAARPALEHVGMMQQPIEQGRHGGRVTEQLAPVVHWSI
jgi:hypothetical protein